jgi:hypothetical protein
VKKLNLIGKRFRRLVVIKEISLRDKHGSVLWECLCDCGNTAIVSRGNLRCGDTKSCGCYGEETRAKSFTKHGCSSNPIYQVWTRMIQRCYNLKHKSYKNYGGRGITICLEWKDNPKKFIVWAEINGWRKTLDIDRFDNDKGYCPDNCRFVTRSESNLNTRLLRANNTTGFRGVYWHKAKKKYMAGSQLDGKQYYLGLFISAVEAAKARDKFIIERGLHAPLNFPDQKQAKDLLKGR